MKLTLQPRQKKFADYQSVQWDFQRRIQPRQLRFDRLEICATPVLNGDSRYLTLCLMNGLYQLSLHFSSSRTSALVNDVQKHRQASTNFW